jgi:acyl-coenzyme A synthetase/AMP-(fatty) acid ligase
MSECSTFISGSPERPAPTRSLGFPQPGRKIAVLREDRQPVPPGETGILAIHRSDPGLCLGYLRADGTIDLPLAGEWFLTGDLVSENPDGSLGYHGRRDDLMTTGGFRVSPLEIEAVFHDAPGVEDCAALALSPKPDTTVVALALVGDADEATLRGLAEARLARYKQPRAYIRLPALPRSPNGKLDRRALAQAVRKDAP